MQLLDFQTQVQPNSLAREGAQRAGKLTLSQLPRFASLVESSSELDASLVYGQDEEGVFIDTHLKGSCELLCQHCLESYPFSLKSLARFRPVYTLEAAREVPEDSEPVLYEEGFVNIINMLEDDAMLAVPTYPKCKNCELNNKTDTFPSQFATIAGLDL
jgi:uncharacterized protein